MKKNIKRLLVFLCIACMSIPLCSCGIKDKVDDWLDEQLGISSGDDKDSSTEDNNNDSSDENGGGSSNDEETEIKIELDKLNIYF